MKQFIITIKDENLVYTDIFNTSMIKRILMQRFYPFIPSDRVKVEKIHANKK